MIPTLPTALSAAHGRGRRPKPEPIDAITLGECCFLFAMMVSADPARAAEFFNLTGSRAEKISFLLRHGGHEGSKTQ